MKSITEAILIKSKTDNRYLIGDIIKSLITKLDGTKEENVTVSNGNTIHLHNDKYTQIDFDDWKSAGLPMEINIEINKNLNFGLMGNLDDMTININSNKGTPYIYFDITQPVNKTTTINGNFYININSVEGKILYIFNNGKPQLNLNSQFGWKGKGKWGFSPGIYGNLGKKYPGLIKQYKRFYFDYIK
nr:MAG TPA: hypothetical protein [Caudoviricetes sp.]